MVLNLTRDVILEDIEEYRKRIRSAQQKLSALPKNARGYQERRKISFKRRVLEQEIVHVKGLVLMAKEALENL